MKTKFNGVLTLLLALVVQFTFAQEKNISGVVSDEFGPVSDITILVKGTDNGTVTDFDGNYTIKAKTGDTLVFSHISYQTIEKIVGASNSINVTLSDSGNQLEEVIVTALGIKKEKKALGYAVTTINAEDLEQKATGDIAKILKGKAAGVNIIAASGLSGAGSSITIRGLTSFGNNQPLYVVDGVRFNSSTTGQGFNSTSRSLDIDPNNIKSINVLKGLSAATLYGADGKDGVIVITTKAGARGGNHKKKTEVTITAGTFVNQIASLPEFTNERGQGYYDAYYNFFGNWGATFGNPNFGNVDSNGQVANPYALNSPVFNNAFPDQSNSRVDYKNYKSQENFFENGVVTNLHASVNGGTEKAGFNISASNTVDDGFVPNNSLRRNTISIGGNVDLSNNLNFSSTINYTDISFNTPDVFSIFTGLLNTPRSIDLAGLPWQHPITGEEINFQDDPGGINPYWVLNNTNRNQEVARTFGQISASYDINDNLTAVYRYGYDVSIDERTSWENRGRTGGGIGSYSTSTLRETGTNHTFMISYGSRFSNDKFGISIDTGADLTRKEFDFNNSISTDQQVFGLLEHQFFTEHDGNSFNSAFNRPGIFIQSTLDYNNYLFLNFSARNDWTSNFVNNSQFYPGFGLSFIPTQAFKGLKSKTINYVKLRANYGSSADFGDDIFIVSQTLGDLPPQFDDGNGVVTTSIISPVLANAEIGPALISELEFGIETKLWNNRINFDFTYYNRVTKDLIFNRATDPSTGFTLAPRNVNEFKVNGIEIEFDVDIIKSENFSVNIGGNFTKNESEVTELEEERFAVTNVGPVGNFLVEGEPINVLVGTVIETDDQGNYITDGRSYITAADTEIIGDPNPDFISSFFTAIKYKNLSLTANLQYRKGGDIYSQTARSLLGRGLTTDGDGLNNAGFVLPGVINVGTADVPIYEPNTVVISSGDALFNEYNNGPAQFGIFDGTTIRLQEVALTYSFNKKILDKTPFGAMTISLVGENLYFDAINMPDGLNFDTNTIGTGVNSNGAGIDTADGPSSKRYGLNLKLSF